MQEYYSLPKGQIFTSEIEIQKSRFLGFAKYVDDVDQAAQFVQDIKAKYKDAKHVVYAYIVDGIQKSSDDREPSGTAGKPMLEYLMHNTVNHLAVAIVRYFGGINLGTGGLLRAYQGTCKSTMHSHLVRYIKGQKYCIVLSYSEYQDFQKTYKQHGIKILKTTFDRDVILEIVAFAPINIAGAQFEGEVFDTLGEVDANN